MLIYRLEQLVDGNWIGIYRNWSRLINSLHDKYERIGDRHPAPYEDPLLDGKVTNNYYFGFGTIQSYKNWFCKGIRLELGKEHRNEVRLCEYDVSYKNVIIGEKQVMFDKSFAVLKATYEADHFDREGANETC